MSIGFFSIFSLFGSLNYSEVFTLVPYLNETAITIIALLLLGGALAKSANIPLHSWLPGSMEAWHIYINLFIYFQFIFPSAECLSSGMRENLLYLFNLDLSILYCFSIPILPDPKKKNNR